jgi:hypothetical protein
MKSRTDDGYMHLLVGGLFFLLVAIIVALAMLVS